MKNGMVSLVGAGCGDPEFLTQKALGRLKGCEVLIYDSLVSEQIVAQAPGECEKIYVGKRYGRHAMKQEEINVLLIQKAREGKRVVRLKGGDPYVFGRGGEEFWALLDAGIDCEEIPGITSCIAVPAAAGIPVTHRGLSRSFTVITGTTAKGDGAEALQMDFETLARLEGTLVILMGVHHLKEIADGLMAAGKEPATPCAVIMEGTTDRQKCVRSPLHAIAAQTLEAGIKPPAVIVVGAVAQMELVGSPAAKKKECALPLCKITAGVIGTPRFVEKLSRALREKGASVCDMGFMQVRENGASLPGLSRYGWLVFTSPNGARIFLDKMKREKRDLREIGSSKIAVIGPGTAQVFREAGIYADYMPQTYDAAHLAEGLTERILAQDEQNPAGNSAAGPALFLRAAGGSEKLPLVFQEKGLPFAEFELYEIGVDEKRREQVLEETPDYLVFGAGSGVRAYFEGMQKALGKRALPDGISEEKVSLQKHPRFVCMGKACSEELGRFTKEEFLVAQESSIEGVVDCICSAVNG